MSGKSIIALKDEEGKYKLYIVQKFNQVINTRISKLDPQSTYIFERR